VKVTKDCNLLVFALVYKCTYQFFKPYVMKHFLRISAVVLLLGAALASCAPAYTACGAYTCVDIDACE